MATTQHDKAARFRALHQGPGAFVIANAWDAGSARVLAGLGFPAIATSSGAQAGTLGKREHLSSRVQEAYNISQEESERQITAWQERQRRVS